MMKLPALCAGALASALVAAPAHADVFAARAELHAGGALGAGLGGAQKDNAFFGHAPPGAYGAQVGASILFADVYIDHTQLTDGSRISTWTQFALGVRIDLKTGKPARVANQPEGHATGYFELGIHAGFGLGTGQQVSPPLDNAQITDKAFVGELRLGFGKLLGNGLRVGLALPVSGGYFFKTGNGAAVNNLSTHYYGVEGAVLLTFGLELGVL